MNILQAIKKKRLYFDGGTGTVLEDRGLLCGNPPESLNLTNPEAVISLHRDYISAGANIIKTNTFGVNPLKYENYREHIKSAVDSAKSAVYGLNSDAYIAYDIGPSGRMLRPIGDFEFKDAVSMYKDLAFEAVKCGVDLFLIETMSDMYETKAAVLGVKEVSNLPIFVTNAYGDDGKLLTGSDPSAMVAMLEGLGVKAIGINCSKGPCNMERVVGELVECASVPVIVNPNAGMPCVVDGKSKYDIDADEFAVQMRELAAIGASVLGGCCGTTPEYIRALVNSTRDTPYNYPDNKNLCVVSSYTHAVAIGDKPLVVGERVNPTGKKKIKEALITENLTLICQEAIAQQDSGAHLLDINVGEPSIDEEEMLARVVYEVQSICNLPLQIDTGNSVALENALRIYNGKPLINSVNGSEKSLNSVLPLVKKYGGVVVALTMDENGIPNDVQGRVEIAKRIYARAKKFGLRKCDIVFDTLTMSIASGKENARVTLEAMKKIKALGFNTTLGVSNISFGMPERDLINSAFLTMALHEGLDLAIINPISREIMNAYYAHGALSGRENGGHEYIDSRDDAHLKKGVNIDTGTPKSLCALIERGIKDDLESITDLLIDEVGIDRVINEHIVVALNRVGEEYQAGRSYLPNLIRSAECASLAFGRIKCKIGKKGGNEGIKVCIATVEGDVHDIGKNIVKLMLESRGCNVLDLGKNVPSATVVARAREFGADIISLSALMTTTVPSMRECIERVHCELPGVPVMVGGAVITEELAKQIGADIYARDALEAEKKVMSIQKR